MRFVVYGEPQGKARPRFARGRTYTPKNTVEYEKRIRNAFIETGEKSFGEKPVGIRLICKFGIPKSTPKKRISKMLIGLFLPTKKPDVDNIAKVYMDALNGVAYDDDKQVVCLVVYKQYDEKPHVHVDVYDYEKLMEWRVSC